MTKQTPDVHKFYAVIFQAKVSWFHGFSRQHWEWLHYRYLQCTCTRWE